MKHKRGKLAKREQAVTLNAEGIDRLSALIVEALTEVGTDRKDVIRLRLAIEDILMLWHDALGDDTRCVFRCGSRLGRMNIEIIVPGQRLDPSETEEEAGGLLYSNLLAQAGLSPVYSYRDGQNHLALYPPKPQRMNPLVQLVLAMVLAVLCGILCLLLPQPVKTATGAVVEPLFTALMGILQTLAGPMIFLSVCWGIVCIGDVQVLGRIGRTIISRFIAAIYVTLGISALCLVWLFQSEGVITGQGENAASQIYGMLLGIIPDNMLSPFLEGNSLQIIFMAICVGLVLLLLKEKLPLLHTLVEQLNTAVQFMMETVSRYIPVFTFISLFTLILSDSLSGLGGVVKAILLAMAACIIWPLLYALVAALRLKVSYPLLLRKLLPTYLITLSTASSSAALSTNLDTCEKELGISERISRFAVPLGQVIFKTGGGVGFFVLAMGLAEYYGVAMPLSWVITGVLTSGLLAIAAPPIPGGSLTCYTVLLAQLGIPAQAVALAIAGNVILDFFMTSCGISCLQSELLLAANRLGLLNKGRLRKEETV